MAIVVDGCAWYSTAGTCVSTAPSSACAVGESKSRPQLTIQRTTRSEMSTSETEPIGMLARSAAKSGGASSRMEGSSSHRGPHSRAARPSSTFETSVPHGARLLFPWGVGAALGLLGHSGATHSSSSWEHGQSKRGRSSCWDPSPPRPRSPRWCAMQYPWRSPWNRRP